MGCVSLAGFARLTDISQPVQKLGSQAIHGSFGE